MIQGRQLAACCTWLLVSRLSDADVEPKKPWTTWTLYREGKRGRSPQVLISGVRAVKDLGAGLSIN